MELADADARGLPGGAAVRHSEALKSIIGHMDAVRIETTADERGEVHLTKLSFSAREAVEVIVVRRPVRQKGNGFPLRGVSTEYDQPTDPVAEED